MATRFQDRQTASEKIVSNPNSVGQPGPASANKFMPLQNPSDDQSVLTAEKTGYQDLTQYEKLNTLAANLNDRVDQARRDNKDQVDLSVSLYDIDSAMLYYFTNVIHPTVQQGGQTIPVEIMYASPERWAAMQTLGYIRDNKGKLLLPLIIYNRTGEVRNEAIVFPRTDKLNMTALKKWDKTTRYDKFLVLNGKPNVPNGYTIALIPNYMIISYQCIIWTAFKEQINPIVEKINFTDNTYWGDPQRFKFRTMIDGFSNTVELTADTERAVKTEFNVTMYGYLMPKDAYNKLTTRISIAPKKVVFEEVFPDLTTTTPTVTVPFYDAETSPQNFDYNTNIPDIDLSTIPD